MTKFKRTAERGNAGKDGLRDGDRVCAIGVVRGQYIEWETPYQIVTPALRAGDAVQWRLTHGAVLHGEVIATHAEKGRTLVWVNAFAAGETIVKDACDLRRQVPIVPPPVVD